MEFAAKFRAIWIRDDDIPQVCKEKIVDINQIAGAWRRAYRQPFNLEKLGFVGDSPWTQFVEACYPFLHHVNRSEFDGISVAWLFHPPGQIDDWKTAPKGFTRSDAGITRKMLQGYVPEALGKVTAAGLLRSDDLTMVEAKQFLRRDQAYQRLNAGQTREQFGNKAQTLEQEVGFMSPNSNSHLRRSAQTIPTTPTATASDDLAGLSGQKTRRKLHTRRQQLESEGSACAHKGCEKCDHSITLNLGDAPDAASRTGGRRGTLTLLEAMSQLESVRHVDLTKLMELFPDIATMQREHDQNHATCNGIFTFSNERFLCGGSVFEMRMTCDCEPSLCEEKFLSVGERVEDAAAKSKQVSQCSIALRQVELSKI